MNQKRITALTAISVAVALALTACGGGGGGSGGSGSNNSASNSGNGNSAGGTTTSPTVTGTVTTPQFAANSAQMAAFTLLNQYRQQCGFPVLQENTVLDAAAQNHSKYMGLNNAFTDAEVSTNAGYSGSSYTDRAVYAGFPQGVSVGGASGGGNAVFPQDFSASVAGQQFVYGLVGGVYHSVIANFPANIAGLGEYETQATVGSYTYTDTFESLSITSTQAQTLSNAPLTFPCQGVTGVPYKEVAESPTPPNVSASGSGTPVVVIGNSTDSVFLQSATMTDTSGNVITLQLLNSTNDPNKLISASEAVAYPTSPLLPNVTYTVSITGIVNGAAFSRNFTFTTGNVTG
ncbi:CAP domain-containing protein [Paraburkholderia sp. A3BS-1L]|uniref:CAP domain-containing protein n=1 Tax=Paraburkholderia sp. A3BS-1L TaxID=3028375 RepID=UPI003DA9B3DD